MTWRSVFVTKNCYLLLKNRQFFFQAKNEEKVTIPIEDIAVVILESHQITLSTALLNSLVQNGVVIYVCDEKHMPSGVMLSFNQHSRTFGIQESQIK